MILQSKEKNVCSLGLDSNENIYTKYDLIEISIIKNKKLAEARLD